MGVGSWMLTEKDFIYYKIRNLKHHHITDLQMLDEDLGIGETHNAIAYEQSSLMRRPAPPPPHPRLIE